MGIPPRDEGHSRDHDHERCQRCTPDSRDGEELSESCNVVALADDIAFDFDLGINIVEISGCQELVVAEHQK
jgi:hypothetical protein